MVVASLTPTETPTEKTMPPQQAGATNVLAKIAQRAKAAVMSAADKPAETSGLDDLPPGIRNGVVQITDCGFFYTKPESQTKKADGTSAVGEPYYQQTGVIIEPEYVEYQGRRIKVKGRQARLYIPVFDTKNQAGEVTKLEAHLGGEKDAAGNPVVPAKKNVMNELKKLGAPPELFKKFGGDLEKVAAFVKSAKPYSKFSTSPRKDQATGEVNGSWENWDGCEGLEDYKPGGPSKDEVLDESAHVPAGKAESRKVADEITAANRANPKAAATAGDDLDQLLRDATADGVDEATATAATDRLRALAKGVGKTDDEVTNSDSWEQVVGWIKGGGSGGGDEIEPALEDVFLYDAGDGKGPQEHEVTAIDEAGRTVTLKNMDTKQVVKDKRTKKPLAVPFAALASQPY